MKWVKLPQFKKWDDEPPYPGLSFVRKGTKITCHFGTANLENRSPIRFIFTIDGREPIVLDHPFTANRGEIVDFKEGKINKLLYKELIKEIN